MKSRCVAELVCECGRPIIRGDQTCGCCREEAYVTLQQRSDPLTQKNLWEIFMGKPTDEPVATLACILCSRAVTSADRRCECGVYCRLALVSHIVEGTLITPASYRWELHLFVTEDEETADSHDVIVFPIESDSLSVPSKTSGLKSSARPLTEREKLRQKAKHLLQENSYRKTADILGLSLGKLQYLVREDES